MRGVFATAPGKAPALVFVKRTFYLGKEVLCYPHKEGTGGDRAK